MSEKRLDNFERDAIWQAYQKKCFYTNELLAFSDVHIDHSIPEALLKEPSAFNLLKEEYGLSTKFDINGYENLVPCKARLNLLKGKSTLNKKTTLYYLSLTQKKKRKIEKLIKFKKEQFEKIKPSLYIQELLKTGKLSKEEVSSLLESMQNKNVYKLFKEMNFVEKNIALLEKDNIETLLNKPVLIGGTPEINGIAFVNNQGKQKVIKTCKQYNKAIQQGFFANTTTDIKLEASFRYQCGLLSAISHASPAKKSFVSEPRVGIVDLHLLPASMVPELERNDSDKREGKTYQDLLSDGLLEILAVKQNSITIKYKSMLQYLSEVTRADFNGDGIEDIFINEYCRAVGGTLGYGNNLILTRKSFDALFKVISYD